MVLWVWSILVVPIPMVLVGVVAPRVRVQHNPHRTIPRKLAPVTSLRVRISPARAIPNVLLVVSARDCWCWWCSKDVVLPERLPERLRSAVSPVRGLDDCSVRVPDLRRDDRSVRQRYGDRRQRQEPTYDHSHSCGGKEAQHQYPADTLQPTHWSSKTRLNNGLDWTEQWQSKRLMRQGIGMNESIGMDIYTHVQLQHTRYRVLLLTRVYVYDTHTHSKREVYGNA
jgi:hypothetical protein